METPTRTPAPLAPSVALLIERALLAAHEAETWDRHSPMLAALRRRDALALVQMAAREKALLEAQADAAAA